MTAKAPRSGGVEEVKSGIANGESSERMSGLPLRVNLHLEMDVVILELGVWEGIHRWKDEIWECSTERLLVLIFETLLREFTLLEERVFALFGGGFGRLGLWN